MILKVGLTGAIGSGKSTVAHAFTKLGVATFSADSVGHKLSAQGQPGYQKIVAEFGHDILQPNGDINRSKLGDIVFNNASLKQKLESILHPLIMHRLHQQAESVKGIYCILDIPLLINTAERDKVDRILVVDCDAAMRISRIKHRNGWTEEKILAVMSSQPTGDELISAADDVLDNNGSLTDIDAQVDRLHQRYSVLAKANLAASNKG